MDRFLRKEAGELNLQAGRLQYVVRDLRLHRPKNPRELPEYLGTKQPSQSAYNVSYASSERSYNIIVNIATVHKPPSRKSKCLPIGQREIN
ncbi:hypothetical protein Aduo_010067 [Ancylostoma duodenale]